MALHQRHLREREKEGERQEAERLEADPGIGREIAPDDLVDDRHGDEEGRPAQGELAPALLGEGEGRAEQKLEHRLLQQKPAGEQHGEHRIDDGRLELDEGLVAEIEREPAEHEHDDAADERHHRQLVIEHAGDGERDERRHHERGGGGIDPGHGVGGEEHQQRPELDGELGQERGLRGRWPSRALRLALRRLLHSRSLLPRSRGRNLAHRTA